jgi:hypothetical protein
MAKKKKPEEPKDLDHLKDDRSVAKFDGTLDGMALTIKAPEETDVTVRRRIVELLRHDEDMGKFVECADFLLKRRGASYPSLDVIAAKAGLDYPEVVGAIAKALHRFSFDYSRIIAAASMPRVMNTLANEAAHPDGHADRTLFLRATGHLPTGGGTHVNVTQTAVARSEAAALALTHQDSGGLPAFEGEVKANIRAIRTVDVLPG